MSTKSTTNIPWPFIGAGVGAALVFVAAVAIMLAMLPGPLRPVDFFLAGSIATLIASVALLLTVARISKVRDTFYRKRRRSSSETVNEPGAQ